MEFSRQEYCSGLPSPSPDDLSNPGIELHCRQILYCLSHLGSPSVTERCIKTCKCNCGFISTFISLSEFSTVCCYPHKGFGIVNKAEVDVFLELSCFLNDPTDVGNLISGSSAFSKSSWDIWMFTVHILLKPGWRILSITLLACEMSAIVR